ncbi:MAG: sulfatase-like hydrolase/transferase [Verrucomicrobiota bacterium]
MKQTLSLFSALLFVPLTTIPAAETHPKPNILVILADDLGYGELGCYGGKDAPTPNLDAMAKAGVLFTSGYVTCPVCSPTRAALITGKYQQRFGHENNIDQSWDIEHPELMGLPVDEKTVADRLKDVGYRTACIGKWHLGVHRDFHPQSRGFDEFFGFLEGGRAYLSDDDPANFYIKSTPPFKQVHFKENGRSPIYRGHDIVEEKEYLTDAFTREAMRFIDAKSDQPFFVYLAYNAVHTPITPCERWETKLRHIEDPVRRSIASMTAAMDEDIGKLRSHLRERGIEDNTLIIFLSDNGGSPGGHNTRAEAEAVNYSINTPLRGYKGQCWEGGVRIPYIVEWPGHVKSGMTNDHAVSSLDIAPTALAAAGASPMELTDGVNLLPFLDGTALGVPHEKLFWRYHIYKAARKGSMKLVKQRAKADELYDLATDLSETKNLAADHPELVEEMNKELAAWEDQMIPPRWNQRYPIRPDGKPLFPRQVTTETNKR